jgi:hypothetical protein
MFYLPDPGIEWSTTKYGISHSGHAYSRIDPYTNQQPFVCLSDWWAVQR